MTGRLSRVMGHSGSRSVETKRKLKLTDDENVSALRRNDTRGPASTLEGERGFQRGSVEQVFEFFADPLADSERRLANCVC